MTLDIQASASFNSETGDPGQIGHAKKVHEEKPRKKHFFPETWSVAWSPDTTYFAWSEGDGIVQLLPWDSARNTVYNIPTNSNCLKKRHPLIEDVSTEISSGNTQSVHLQPHRLDCGEVVWSMAFNHASMPDDNKPWCRFHDFRRDVILGTGLMNGRIKLWSVAAESSAMYSHNLVKLQGYLLMELMDHRDIVRDLSFSPEGKTLVSCSNDRTIKFWDLGGDGNMYRTQRMCSNTLVLGCKWSPTGKHLAAVGTSKSAYIWKIDDLSHPRKLTGHVNNVTSCHFSPDGAMLATGSYDTRVILWNVDTGDIIHVLHHMLPPPRPIYAGGANDHFIRGISISRNGLSVCTVADDGYLRQWDIRDTSNPVSVAKVDTPLSCAYSPNGTVIATGTSDGVEFYQAERTIAPLQHLCRMVVRKQVASTHVDMLQFPVRLKEYLKYHE